MSAITRTIISTSDAIQSVLPLSQAVVVDRLVYLSGCLGIDKDTMQLVPGGAGPETRKALEHVTAILKAAGSSVENVVKTLVFVSDLNDFQVVNEEYQKVFTSNFPARSCVQVAKLPFNGRVEIEVIGIVGKVNHRSQL